MSDIDNRELNRMLQQAFDASTKIYQERGFQRRIGFGRRPALVLSPTDYNRTVGLAVVCLWLAGRVFVRENA